MRRYVLVWVCVAATILALPTWAVNYTATDLGILGLYNDPCSGKPTGYSRATAINNSGQVVGVSSLSTGEQGAFIWTASEGMRQLSGITDHDRDCGLQKITNTGKVLVTSQYIGGYGCYDIASGTFASSEYELAGINDCGDLCANRINGSYTFPMFKSESDSWTDIDSLPSFAIGRTYASDMNEEGQICGTAYDGSANRRTAVFWNSAGNITDIGTPIGYQTSYSTAINDNGWVLGHAGYYINSSWHFDPFVWHQDYGFTMIEGGIAYDINNHNQVLGASWLWDASSGMSYLTGISARAINDQGWIIGTRMEDGQTHSVLLQPVPEPSSVAILFTAMSGLIAAIRRQRRY